MEVEFRPEVEAECRLGGMTAAQALELSTQCSTQAYLVRSPEGEPLAYWGWRDDACVLASCKAWMLSTSVMDRWPVFAARRSKEYLRLLLATHYSVEVLVDPSYEKTITWLHWLGFRRCSVLDHFDIYRITQGGLA